MPRRVVFTVFAGRRCYLEVLFRYVDALVRAGRIQEVHVWNYARDETDRTWVNGLSRDAYRVIVPLDASPGQWDEYYKFYSEDPTLADDDVLIKCDDDVVYIDVDKFGPFVDAIDGDRVFLPNIVNNDVCAHLQSLHGVHSLLRSVRADLCALGCTSPLTYWFRQHSKADAIHSLFLAAPGRFALDVPPVAWRSRISINFFATRGGHVRRLFDRLCRSSKVREGIDDEAFFATDCLASGTFHLVVLSFVVVHFSFHYQNEMDLREKHLAAYAQLSHDSLAPAGGRNKKKADSFETRS